MIVHLFVCIYSIPLGERLVRTPVCVVFPVVTVCAVIQVNESLSDLIQILRLRIETLINAVHYPCSAV